jgi:hypothetical protein
VDPGDQKPARSFFWFHQNIAYELLVAEFWERLLEAWKSQHCEHANEIKGACSYSGPRFVANTTKHHRLQILNAKEECRLEHTCKDKKGRQKKV